MPGIVFKLLFLLAAIFSSASTRAELCGGPLDNNNFNRPLDYTSDQDKYGFGEGASNKLKLVEDYHFDRDVEMLVAGMQGPLPGDIHYTLMHFPNHYRALHAMARWHLKNPNPSDEECDCLDWLLPADCYFTRALTFTPDDGTLYYIYGIYLHKKTELDKAKGAYLDAARLGANSAEFHYNFGLLLLELGDYEEARKQARQAYSMGAPFPGLRKKLEKLGRW